MLGGGGSIQAMITSLSNNKKLLRSKRLFKKERTFLNIKKEYLNATEGKLNLKKASKEELQRIRKKIIKERRKENKIVIVIAIIITSIMIYFTVNIIQQNNYEIKNQKTLVFKKKEKEFLILVNKGDEWFEKGKWYNSIFYYEKAKKIFQKNYEINYRLVRSYSYQCESEFKNCREAKKLVDKLLLMFPDKEKELLEIKGKLEYEY
ncbi:hypothetical protein GCM10022393_39590 [Aquimarina addita]|uniref:Tetratricopeptide repeat protein n=1 Tax=Aquimarina addita TaxID=870485 RepID=A0ABP6UTR3_9FLAO